VLRRRQVLLASHSLRSVRLVAGAQSRKPLNAANFLSKPRTARVQAKI
jgi:hypothetical protein